MRPAPRLLADVRETETLRGFHALAALSLIAGRLKPVRLYRLGGEEANEAIACQAFCFDTGLTLRRYRPLIARIQPFDLYLAAADVLPWDAASVAARRASRRTVAALMFGLREFQPFFAGVVVPGHDTSEIAARVADELALAGGSKDA